MLRQQHELKCHPEPFAALRSRVKRHEWRRDDRGFQVGDCLKVNEWDPSVSAYTGRAVLLLVTYISRGPDFGIPHGFVVMSVDLVVDLGNVHRSGEPRDAR